MSDLLVYLHVPVDSRIPISLFLENDSNIPRNDPCLFKFQLSRKKAYFGDLLIDQFWMKPTSIYGTESDSLNHISLVGCFWALNKRAKSAGETGLDIDAAIETYVLACLLPQMRTNGSRSVFMDQVPQGSWKNASTLKHAGLDQSDFDLNSLLAKSDYKQESMYEFHRLVGKVLGPKKYDKKTRESYAVFSNYLFGRAQGTFKRAPDQGLDAVFLRWKEWMRGIGRHRGKKTEKTVLDILSYEGRTAIHRCYASVWEELLPLLAKRFELTVESQLFHRLWHRDHIVEATPTTSRFHLFHGHVFALHPASSFFAKSDIGRRLIGDAITEGLSNCGDQAAFQRFLAAFRVAVFVYYKYIKTVAEERKNRPISLPNERVIQSKDTSSTKSSRRKLLTKHSY